MGASVLDSVPTWFLTPIGASKIELQMERAARHRTGRLLQIFQSSYLKGLSYEVDFENVDENLQILALKVVTNEKRGESRSWQVFEDGTGPWRSMSVYFLMLPSSFLRSISVSCL